MKLPSLIVRVNKYITRNKQISGIMATSLLLAVAITAGNGIVTAAEAASQADAAVLPAAAAQKQPVQAAVSVQSVSGVLPANPNATASATASPVTPRAAAKPAATSTKQTGSQPTPGSKAVSSSKPSPTPATPPKAQSPAPKPTPCPECGGDPDKVTSYIGNLVLSSNSVTISKSDQFNPVAYITARASNGASIGGVFIGQIYGPELIFPSSSSFNLAPTNTFRVALGADVAPGTYRIDVFSKSADNGEHWATVTVTVIP